MKATFASIARNIARRMWRRRAYWILQGLLAAIPLVISIIWFLTDVFYSSQATPELGVLPLYILVFPFLVGPALLDDFGKIGEILFSGPLDSLTYFATAICGLWLGLFPGVMLQLSILFLADLLEINHMGEWSWLVSILIYLIVNLTLTGLILLLTTLLRRFLPLVLSWTAGWVWIFIIVIFADSMSEGFQPLSSIAFTNIFFQHLPLSPSLGLGLVQDQVLGMFAWFFSLGFASTSLALLILPRVDPRRSTRWQWVPPALFGISLITVLAGFQLNHSAAAAHQIPPSPLSPQSDQWEVLFQDTQVEADASNGYIAGSMRIRLSPRQVLENPEIILRLNASLSVTSVMDEDNMPLAASRFGDSIVIALPGVPTAPVSLTLSWQGRLHIPYSAYEQWWKFPDAPGDWNFTYMPHPLNAFVQPVGGYLLRDGDWKPWPWSTLPHQALENRVVLRPKGGEAAASSPIHDGKAIWEGDLPEALLVFLPEKKIQSGSTTLAVSPLASSQLIQKAALLARSAQEVAAVFDTPPPRFIVAAPYLSKVIWSGDILLLPDGSGYYLSQPVQELYYHEAGGPDQAALARASTAIVARAYLLTRVPADPLEFKPRIQPPGETAEVITISAVKEKDWLEGNGHWIQAAEQFDVITDWNPRRQIRASSQGEWSAVAFWLAMELADEGTRQADLDFITDLDAREQPFRAFAREQYDQAFDLVWPQIMETQKAREIVWGLHLWAAAVDPQGALEIFAAVILETNPATVEELTGELEKRTGLTIPEVQR